MKSLLWFILIVLISTGLLLFSAGLACSQWIGFETPPLGLPSLSAGPFPNAGYPGLAVPQGYGQPASLLYSGSAGFPGQNPYSASVPPVGFPGLPNAAYPNGWNGSYPWSNNSFPPPGANYNPNPGGQFAGGFYPNVPYPSSSYSTPWYPGNYSQLGPYPYWSAPNYYPYWPPESGGDSDEDSEEADPPSDVAGVWIGTWTSTFVTNGDFCSYTASISLAQEEGTVSGAFLFVENSYIHNLSATGVVEEDEISMTASIGDGESEKTILFEGEAVGNTWTGEYIVMNSNEVAIELGEFVVSRI